MKPISVTARNYAAASDNKMHEDATAARFGFRGGLVPGVGVYGYMTMPIARELGLDWLERGAMWGKFLKPVYDGETVQVHAEIASRGPLVIETRVVNSEGVECAIGRATERTAHAAPQIGEYPRATLPERDSRPPGDLEHLPVGIVLGSLSLPLDLQDLRGESGALFADEMADTAPHYRGANAACHPAFYPALANRILVANVKLGPWIHTESTVDHFRLPATGTTLQVRGRVTESFEKRGHECVKLDVAIFDDQRTAIARVIHSAIVRPAPVRATA